MARKKEPLIRSVGYLRKSTKGEDKKKRRQRQEKSIPQQRQETVKLAEGRFEIVDWYDDPGVSGSRRGLSKKGVPLRPGFHAMLERAKDRHDFEAILCDNLDRFSRASVDEVQEDALALKRAGVRFIVTGAQGTFDLGRSGHDIGEILKFVVAVWSAHEYSRQQGRRVALAGRNAALEGKRMGGNAPYGFANDGKGGYVHGDPKQIRVVRWIFEEFVEKARSMRSIVEELNTKGIPSSYGGKWSTKVLADVLRRRAYRGDFSYGTRRAAQHFGLDEKGEVVEVAQCNGKPGKVFVKKGAYTAIVEPKLFDKAQKRLETLGGNRSLRKAQYALSGVLVCGHCGGRMYGVVSGPATVYRCGSTNSHGPSACKNCMIREDRILPFVLRVLDKEIRGLAALRSKPTKVKTSRSKEERAREREELERQIARAEDNILLIEDARTRQSLDKRLTEMRDRLEALQEKPSGAKGLIDREAWENAKQMLAWWDDFKKKAIKAPLKKKDWGDGLDIEWPAKGRPVLLLDPRIVNETLKNLGAEVRLWWKTENRKIRQRHILVKGRFRLGQWRGKIPVERGLITPGRPGEP